MYNAHAKNTDMYYGFDALPLELRLTKAVFISQDVLIVESTYGTHIHEKREDREHRFTSTIQVRCQNSQPHKIYVSEGLILPYSIEGARKSNYRSRENT